MGGPLRTLLALLIGLLPGLAFAETSAEIAVEAARVRDELCSDAAGSDTTLAATVSTEASAVWSRVSAAYESSQEPFLLYWRGVLEQCLDLEERASEDLERFLLESGDDATYADLARDARRRLRRLAAGGGDGPDAGPAVATGIATAAGAGLLSALAAWQQDVSAVAEARYYSGTLSTAQFPFVESDVQEAAVRRNALAVAAGALAAGSIASFVVVGTRSGGASSDLRGQPVISLAPRPEGGFVLGASGRW